MQKENAQRRRQNRERVNMATLTTDVSHILKAINSNTMWKNSSAKLNKTINTHKPHHGTHKPTHKKPLMTEEDIDKLFAKSKSKSKAPAVQESNPQQLPLHATRKDFANSVRFLKVDDEPDRLLSGLVRAEDLTEEDDRTGEDGLDLTGQFKRDYMVGKVVGEGAYASVRVAVFKPTNRKVAIKVYEKGKLREPQRKKSVRRQIRILQNLGHPNVVRILDVVETNNHLNIIMEYLEGISLSNYLKTHPNHRAPEKHARTIVRALAEALDYLHLRQISHRDIKLENIILSEELSPKLIDFGFSTCIEKGKRVKIFCGTPSYMAPQIVQKREYRGQPADIWALGVLTFVALTGIFPFKGATDQQLYRKINAAEYPRHELYFSKEVADLIAKMLRINPEQRITASQILTHPWITQRQAPRDKRQTQISECRKRTTISSHKSRERDGNTLNATGNIRKLTQTCQDNNLRLQLRMIRQSPLKLASTTKRCSAREQTMTGNGGKQVKNMKKETKNHPKVLQLLKAGLRKPQDKSRSKPRRL